MAEHVHFVTGRLAAHSLQTLLDDLAPRVGFTFSVDVLPITVAALMTPAWIAKRIRVPEQASSVIVPGYCDGDLSDLESQAGVPVQRGPRDLRQLPEFFGRDDVIDKKYGPCDIKILAEINHAPRLALAEILAEADAMRASGADIIDVGCEPGEPWMGVATSVAALRDAGHRVSIDSLNPREIEPAIRAGAELVLSVNSTNVDAAVGWGCEVVVIPDDFPTLGGLDACVEKLAKAGVPIRIDPILEPIGCGFAKSLGRYLEVRRRYPDAEMMMGIGNLTELTDVDSAGVNVLLLGFCQELGIRTVLTTQVINWARSSVRECDLARRLVHFAVSNRIPPKHIEPRLVTLRDPRVRDLGEAQIAELAARIRDNNYRIFADGELLHIVAAATHLRHTDPFKLFDSLMNAEPKNIDASHAFYLGYELAKATTALTLGKQYEQDRSLDWGYLTMEEDHHRLSRIPRRAAAADPSAPPAPGSDANVIE